MSKLKNIFSIILFTPAISFAQDQNKILEVGDIAPALTIQEWIKGEPVTEFKKGQVYVVEFSGTWCSPCRKAIPHLTAMAKKYAADVKVISIYNERNDKKKADDLNYVTKVHALVNAMKDKMDFTVAVDVPQQTTLDVWKIRGWPSAFVVDSSGRIAWKGDPMDLDPVLAAVTTGRFNAAIAIEQQAAFNKWLNNTRKIKNKGHYQTVLKEIDSLLITNPEKKAQLYYLKFEMLAGDDDKKAYEWLQWILENNIEGFDWQHFIDGPFEKIAPKNRNYTIELKAIDRTIDESETKYHSAYALFLKANTYATIGNYKLAIEICEEAIEASKAPGENGSATKRYENKLAELKEKANQNKQL